MKLNKVIYIFSFFMLLVSSCSQESLQMEEMGSSSYLGDGKYAFGVMVDAPEIRTRNVDFSEYGSFLINKVWIGVFDKASGKCVAQKTTALDYRSIKSNEKRENFMYIDLDDPAPEYRNSKFVMVCIANFADVTDVNGNDLGERLGEVEDWDDFNSISVDFTTAYSSPHNGNTPLLAGFLNGETYNPSDPSNSHVKINQFDTSNDGGVHLSPQSLEDDLEVTFTNGKYTTTKKTIYLRRMVANINVTIDVVDPSKEKDASGAYKKHPTLVLNEVSYMKYNLPRSAYIIERRTTDCDIADDAKTVINSRGFPTDASLSPNYADQIPDGGGYISDTEWQLDAVRNSTTEQWNFSFQHFANKHWARWPSGETGKTVNDREATNEDGSFSALANSISDFNNYASYFKMRLHLVDKSTGHAAEAEYVIHEGNTSNELGAVETDENKRLWDFICARNINYTYHVYIAGIDNIFYNVEEEGENEYVHKNGQMGRAWRFYYANDEYNASQGKGNCYYDYSTDMFINAVSPEGGYFENAITVNGTNPDLAFRLYGYNTESGHIEGYNYNFPTQSFEWLRTLWPASAGNFSHYYQDFETLIDPDYSEAIPENILNGLVIHEHQDTTIKYNVREFIQMVTKTDADINDKVFDNKKFDVEIKSNKGLIGPVGESRLNEYVRVIYIADRNGQTDSDGCTTVVNLYSVAQYPEYYTDFAAVPVYSSEQYQRWKDIYNSTHDNAAAEYKIYYANSFQNTGGDAWRGAVNSIVNVGFDIINNLNATRYKVSVLAKGTEVTSQVFNHADCVANNSDPNYVILPLNTGWEGVSTGYYDLEIVLDNPPAGAESGNNPILFEGKLQLGAMNWNFSDSPWKDLTYRTFSNSALSEEKGGASKKYLPEYNFFVERNGLEMALFAIKENTFGGSTDNSLYIASFLDFGMVTGGPTDGVPFHLKFKTVKKGTLNVYVTLTNSTEKRVRVDIDGTFKEQKLMSASTAITTPVQFRIDNVDATNGSEIKIYTADGNNAGRFYRVQFVPD